MPPLVLERHHEHAREAAVDDALALLELSVHAPHACPHAVAESENFLEHGPVLVPLGHVAVCMAVLGVIDVRVDTALEYAVEVCRLGGRLAELPPQKNIEEAGWYSARNLGDT